MHTPQGKKGVIQAMWKVSKMLSDAWAYDPMFIGDRDKGVLLRVDQQVVVRPLGLLDKWRIPHSGEWMWVLLLEGEYLLHKSVFRELDTVTPFSSLVEFLEATWEKRKDLLSNKDEMGQLAYEAFVRSAARMSQTQQNFYFELDELLKKELSEVVVYFQKEGEPKLLKPGDLRRGIDEDLLGCYLRFEKESMRNELPDFSKPEQLRMSLRPKPDHAVKVLAFLLDTFFSSSEFPSIKVVKICGYKSLTRRADSIVVYTFQKKGIDELCKHVGAYARSHEDYFENECYRTTLPVAKGVSISEMPLVVYKGLKKRWTNMPAVYLDQFLKAVTDINLGGHLFRPLSKKVKEEYQLFEQNMRECRRIAEETDVIIPRINPELIAQIVSAVKLIAEKDFEKFRKRMEYVSVVEYEPWPIFLRSKHSGETSYGKLRAQLAASALFQEHTSFQEFFRKVHQNFTEARIDFFNPYRNIYSPPADEHRPLTESASGQN